MIFRQIDGYFSLTGEFFLIVSEKRSQQIYNTHKKLQHVTTNLQHAQQIYNIHNIFTTKLQLFHNKVTTFSQQSYSTLTTHQRLSMQPPRPPGPSHVLLTSTDGVGTVFAAILLTSKDGVGIGFCRRPACNVMSNRHGYG